MKSMKMQNPMDERNTYPCRGCGKPHLEKAARNRHEGSCPQVDQDLDQEPEDQEPEPVEDQDHYQETPPDPEPEITDIPDIEPREQVDPVPEPQGEPLEDRDAGCQCCGAEVNTTRKGFCYGCDLAGCSIEARTCKHRSGVH